MALKLLQPGIEPAGQFDLADEDADYLRGGEVISMMNLDAANDGYAADVGGGQIGDVAGVTHQATGQGPSVQMYAGRLLPVGGAAAGGDSTQFHGLADEGSTGYGTLFGTVIGGTAGQGTGFGSRSTAGVVTVGPRTNFASGKVTCWSKPGLYGVSLDGWNSGITAITIRALGINAEIGGTTATGDAAGAGAQRGKLTNATVSGLVGAAETGGSLAANGLAVALNIGPVSDSSLVSTSNVAAGVTTLETEYQALWLLGPR